MIAVGQPLDVVSRMTETIERPTARAVSIRSALAPFRHGVGDPTTHLTGPGRSGVFARATLTPSGPGTIRLGWSARPDGSPDAALSIDVWGPGADWLGERATAMAGFDDDGAPHLQQARDRVVAEAAIAGRHLRVGRSDDLYHELLPTVIEQRITAREAVRQWARLCGELGEPAPGPLGLTLPPAPEVLSRQPTWWFHPLGVERRRAATLVEIARHASKLWNWADLDPAEAERRLLLLRGIGAWTTGSVLGPALGDPDALCVGDYHAKNVVALALRGRPRGTDDEMLESLEPYRGQRGRILRLLLASGHRAPAFGPRQRILPMHRW